MEYYLKHYALELMTLSPVFIGNGKSFSKKEYLYDRNENTVSFLDLPRFYNGLTELGLADAYREYMLSPGGDLRWFLRKQGVRKNQYADWILYTDRMGDMDQIEKTTKGILEFIKDPYGLPYIPGSSLKGALRTILATEHLLQNPEVAKEIADRVMQEPFSDRKRYLSSAVRDMETKVFHRMLFGNTKLSDMVNDTLRGLIVGDSEPLQLRDLCLCRKIDCAVDGTQHALPILRECLQPKVKITFPVTIDTRVCNLTGKQLLDAVKKYYLYYQDVFLRHFAQSPPTYGNSTTFFLGGGSGYVSKMLMYAVLDQEKRSVKTVSNVIDRTLGTKAKKEHGHSRDESLGISPHMLKCTEYQGSLYQMGACSITKWKRFKPQL